MPASLIERGLWERSGIYPPTRVIVGLTQDHGPNKLAERFQDIERFEKNTSTALVWMGYTVLTLSGRTPGDILTIGEKGMRMSFQSIDSSIKNLPSSLSQIAFFPREIFLPHSDSLTYKEQLEYLETTNRIFKQNFPFLKAKAVIPSVSDWVEALWTQCILKRERKIFSRRENFDYTTTSTLNSDGSVVDIGGVKKINCSLSIDINSHKKSDRLMQIHVAPMLVPDNS